MQNNVQVAHQCNLCKLFYTPTGWITHHLQCKASTDPQTIAFRERQLILSKTNYNNKKKHNRKVRNEKKKIDLQKEKAELDSPSLEHDDGFPTCSTATITRNNIVQSSGRKKKRKEWDSDDAASDTDNDSGKKASKK